MARKGGFIEPTLQRFRVDDIIEIEIHANGEVFLVLLGPPTSEEAEQHYQIFPDSAPLWRMVANRLDGICAQPIAQ